LNFVWLFLFVEKNDLLMIFERTSKNDFIHWWLTETILYLDSNITFVTMIEKLILLIRMRLTVDFHDDIEIWKRISFWIEYRYLVQFSTLKILSIYYEQKPSPCTVKWNFSLILEDIFILFIRWWLLFFSEKQMICFLSSSNDHIIIVMK